MTFASRSTRNADYNIIIPDSDGIKPENRSSVSADLFEIEDAYLTYNGGLEPDEDPADYVKATKGRRLG